MPSQTLGFAHRAHNTGRQASQGGTCWTGRQGGDDDTAGVWGVVRAISLGDSQSLRGNRNRASEEKRPPCLRRGVASRGRVAWEQVEVAAQGATVLRHLLAAVELCARGVALTLLDKCVHLGRETGGPV